MNYSVEERPQGALVVSPSGRIGVENGDGAFVDAIAAVLASRPREVIVDLADVPAIDSCGLGELVAAYLRAQRAGCRLRVVRASRRVTEILRVTRLETILTDRQPGEATRSRSGELESVPS
jgi:anti-sigma B factor antagonist